MDDDSHHRVGQRHCDNWKHDASSLRIKVNKATIIMWNTFTVSFHSLTVVVHLNYYTKWNIKITFLCATNMQDLICRWLEDKCSQGWRGSMYDTTTSRGGMYYTRSSKARKAVVSATMPSSPALYCACNCFWEIPFLCIWCKIEHNNRIKIWNFNQSWTL